MERVCKKQDEGKCEEGFVDNNGLIVKNKRRRSMQIAILVQAEDLQELIENAVSLGLIKAIKELKPDTLLNYTVTEKELLSTGEACKYLHCSRPYLTKLQKEKRIKAYPVGLHNLYRKSELEAYVLSTHMQD